MERQKTAKIKADISTLVRIGHFYFGLTKEKNIIDIRSVLSYKNLKAIVGRAGRTVQTGSGL